MTSRGPLEEQIAEVLTRLSAEGMQRVAEDYARIRFPERFPRFDFRAFSLEGKTRRGWPDAWIDSDGRIDGVEATVNKDKSAVSQHLEEDLQNAKSRTPPMGGLIIVSGHPSVQFTGKEVTELRKRFVDEAGIAADRIDIIFGGGLVQELARPEFARTRFEVLGLPFTPRHFKLAIAKRGPDERRLSDFIPSDEDYARGRVYRPALADQVQARLERSGCALVRGVGACGKSVLAWLLALEATEQRRPAYMLDLADYIDASPATGNELIEDLHRFSHPQVLFVLDNCHLNESLAKEVVLAWQTMVKSQQSRLLLLGRELHSSRGSLIDGLNIEPLTLKARQQELRGVYLRLAWRCTGDQLPSEPPPNVLDDWVRAFGGDPQSPDTTTDLIAFSAAARGRMADLQKGQWTLGESDAIHEIRAVYLGELSDDEKQNLMRLCAVEELEFALSDEALVDKRTSFDVSSKQLGLVFRQSVGASGQYVRYRLAHAALGPLILRSAFSPVNAIAERLAAAEQYPFSGIFMVRRLVASGHELEARAIASRLMLRPAFMLDMESLFHLHLALRIVQDVTVGMPTNLGQMLIAPSERKSLVERALQTPLDALASFLSYAAKTAALQPVFSALTRDLALPANRCLLATSMERQPLDTVVNVLRSNIASELWTAVFVAINVPVWAEARSSEETPKLDAFVEFVRIAADRGRPELAEEPALRLVLSSTPTDWHQPSIGLHHLANVLRMARQATTDDIDRFLDRIATVDWIETRMSSVSKGALAGNLLSLATTLPPNRRKWFQGAGLPRRIIQELSALQAREVESCAQAMALLGAATAMGVSIPVLPVKWPDAAELAEVLKIREPDSSRATIDSMRIQLWSGLRAMACLRTDSVTIPAACGERILTLWQATEDADTGSAFLPHVRDFNTEMIVWLGRCRAAGWCLDSS